MYSDEELKFLEQLSRSEAASRREPSSFILTEETIEQLGVNGQFKKILFYKQTRIKRKFLRELLLFDSEKKTLERYVFENAKNYRLRKRALLKDHELTLSSFDFVRTRSKIISHPQFLIKLVVENEEGFKKMNFYLGDGREKYILGSLEFKNILTRRPIVERVYFFAEGKIIIPIVKYQYLENNLYVIKEKIIPFHLDKETLSERRLVKAENDFTINPLAAKEAFLTESYFGLKDLKIAEVALLLNGGKRETLFHYSALYRFVR